MQNTKQTGLNLCTRSEKIVPVEVYSRVSGYYRPVNQWNRAKRQEFRDRRSLSYKQV